MTEEGTLFRSSSLLSPKARGEEEGEEPDSISRSGSSTEGEENAMRGGRRRRAEQADQAGRSGVERVQTSGSEFKKNRYNMLSKAGV